MTNEAYAELKAKCGEGEEPQTPLVSGDERPGSAKKQPIDL
jgi:hypothetical protein